MISKVLNAPINLFFDVTPTGTILNRFSKDLTVLDEQIFYKFHELNLVLGLLMTTILLVILANWLILLFLPFILFVCYSLFQKFVPAYRQCTRIESITKSPILNQLNESLSGNSTIRAFGKQSHFINNNNSLLNNNILSNQITIASWCWYELRMDIMATLILIISSTLCIMVKDSQDKVLLALVFSMII